MSSTPPRSGDVRSAEALTWLHKARQPHPALAAPLQVPLRFQGATLQGVPYPSLVKIAEDYVARFWQLAPRGMAPFFVGNAGTYKTHVSSWIAERIHLDHKVDVTWCACAHDLLELDLDYFSPSAKKKIDALIKAPFLVMDDISLVTRGSRQMQIVVAIGTMRFDAMRPTLWTGNYELKKKSDVSKLDDAVGVALSRRIMECSEGLRVSL